MFNVTFWFGSEGLGTLSIVLKGKAVIAGCRNTESMEMFLLDCNL
jgi:hypothetical protein